MPRFDRKERMRMGLLVVLLGVVGARAQTPPDAVASPVPSAPATPAAEPAAALSPETLRERYAGSVFRVATAINEHSGMESYGTAFAVDAQGLLATNFHVIANYAHRPDRHKLFVEIAGKSHSAELLLFDVVADLALLRVQQTFTTPFVISTTQLRKGERLYSMGLPKNTVMSLIEGLFNDHQWAGLADVLVFSAPLNSGMSGGPTLNARGEVVGINDAILNNAQNISFGVPAASLTALIEQFRRRAPATAAAAPTGTQNDALVAQQISQASTDWLVTELKANAGAATTARVGRWLVPASIPRTKCWQQEKREGDRIHELRFCSNDASVFVDEDVRAGAFELTYEELRYDSPQTAGAGSIFNGGGYSDMEVRLADFRSARPKDDATSFRCRHERLRNALGVNFLAEYCTTASRRLPGLYDTFVRLLSVDPQDPEPLMVTLRLAGLSRAASLEATAGIVQGVAKAP